VREDCQDVGVSDEAVEEAVKRVVISRIVPSETVMLAELALPPPP